MRSQRTRNLISLRIHKKGQYIMKTKIPTSARYGIIKTQDIIFNFWYLSNRLYFSFSS